MCRFLLLPLPLSLTDDADESSALASSTSSSNVHNKRGQGGFNAEHTATAAMSTPGEMQHSQSGTSVESGGGLSSVFKGFKGWT